uniref:UL46 n=1 Tax=Macrostomum lignano TaxID=282301 RepID=A0A1I8FJ26_9PLAT
MVEFPSFTHDGRTTPDHVSIRTRSPLPGEVHSVHSNASVNTLSPGFQLGLDHIFLAGNCSTATLRRRLRQASFVAIHYLDKLRRIYNYYATLARRGNSRTMPNVLTMLQFWRLMKDCRFINDDCGLWQISNYDPLTPETAHNPYKEVVFLDFLNHLVTIAYHLYGNINEVRRRGPPGKLLHQADQGAPAAKRLLSARAACSRTRAGGSTRPQPTPSLSGRCSSSQCQCERGLPTRSRLGFAAPAQWRALHSRPAATPARASRGATAKGSWVLSVRQFLRMLHPLPPLPPAAAAAHRRSRAPRVESAPASTTSVAAPASVDGSSDDPRQRRQRQWRRRGKKRPSLQAAAAPGRAPNEPPPLPDETYLLAPPAATDGGDLGGGRCAAVTRRRNRRSTRSIKNRRQATEVELKEAVPEASSGAVKAPPTGGGAGGRGGAGSLRAPQQQDSKHSARPTAAVARQPGPGQAVHRRRPSGGCWPQIAKVGGTRRLLRCGRRRRRAQPLQQPRQTMICAREASRDGGSRDALRGRLRATCARLRLLRSLMRACGIGYRAELDCRERRMLGRPRQVSWSGTCAAGGTAAELEARQGVSWQDSGGWRGQRELEGQVKLEDRRPAADFRRCSGRTQLPVDGPTRIWCPTITAWAASSMPNEFNITADLFKSYTGVHPIPLLRLLIGCSPTTPATPSTSGSAAREPDPSQYVWARPPTPACTAVTVAWTDPARTACDLLRLRHPVEAVICELPPRSRPLVGIELFRFEGSSDTSCLPPPPRPSRQTTAFTCLQTRPAQNL